MGTRKAAATLALLGCAWGAPAAAQQATARAEVELVSPLSVAADTPLSFGTVAAGGAAGTVVINPDTGAASASGGVVLIGGPVSAASFSGSALDGKHVKVRVPRGGVTLRRIGGIETMTASAFTLSGKKNEIVVVGGAFDFKVGATLSVGAAQAEGVYEGSFEVTVENF